MKSKYYIAAIVAFFVAAFYVISYASGYKIDITNRNISQTGMIVVQSDPQAKIYLNDTEQGSGNVTVRNLEKGNYNVVIKRDGYYSWSRSFELKGGEANIINDAILFKTDPEISEFKIEQSDFISSLSDTDSLTVVNNEIFQNSQFVTRLAKEIKGVCWYSDRRYIAYTYKDTLKIISIDGTNEVKLLEKKSDTPVVFINSGRSVIYESDGKVYRATIR
ncbi:MAG: PEGA domain-containing protein [bacterium]